MYKSLNVPVTRLEAENNFNLGRSSEITRDELKFSQFIDRLADRFSQLFDDLLEIQLALKGIMKREEWKLIKDDIFYDFLKNNYFTELKESEIIRERMATVDVCDPYVGKYISLEWVQVKVLKMTEAEIAKEAKLMDTEEEEGEYEPTPMQAAAGAGPVTHADSPMPKASTKPPTDKPAHQANNTAKPAKEPKKEAPKKDAPKDKPKTQKEGRLITMNEMFFTDTREDIPEDLQLVMKKVNEEG